jgi:enoyl-CoA hydratase/carnithine racemase
VNGIWLKENRMRYQNLGSKKVSHVLIVDLTDKMASPERVRWLSDDLTMLCEGILLDQEIWVVVLIRGDSQPCSFPIEEGTSELLSPFFENCSIAEPIARIDRPVIAAISGDAIGQGLELALGCDIRIASETSRFGLAQIKAGHIPRDGGTQRLSRLVGKGKALEMILTGETIEAQEALRIGLVNKVVPKKDLMEVTMKMAQEMASKGPIALRYTKEAICKGMDMTLEQGLHLEADLYLLIHTSKDRTEGIQAFREKRAPKFEGK